MINHYIQTVKMQLIIWCVRKKYNFTAVTKLGKIKTTIQTYLHLYFFLDTRICAYFMLHNNLIM